MAFSLAEILIFCMAADGICRLAGIPGLVGMVGVGMLLSPNCLNHLDQNLLNIGADLRLIALIVILLRAGFSIRRKVIAQEGFRIVVLALLPSALEAFSVALSAKYFLKLEKLPALMLGFILPAVSPAVVVPLMLKFNEERIGAQKGIPNLVLAASSLDNAWNILMCGILLEGFETGEIPGFLRLYKIPLSVFSGGFVGILAGFLLYRFFEQVNPRATKRGLTLLAASLLLVKMESLYKSVFPFSAFVAILAMGFIILERRERIAQEIAGKMGKIWVFAEIALFAMVGAQFNFSMASRNGCYGILIIGIGLFARLLGVGLALAGSRFSINERLFVAVCNIPKATVQAAMGAAPLASLKAAGLPAEPGEAILGLSVLTILFTSPLGAWLIPLAARRLLAPVKDGSTQGVQPEGAAWKSSS